MKKMPWGAGSIYGPQPDGRYEVRISLGSVDGKRRRVNARVDTLAAARQKLSDLQARYGKSRGNAAAPKLADYLETWVSGRENKIQAKTVRNYRYGISLIGDRLGHVRLDQLDHDQIAAALDGLRKDFPSRPRAKARSEGGDRALQVAYDTLRAALNSAVKRDRVIGANPLAGVERPGAEREIDYLNRDESKAFLKAVADDRYRALFHLAISCGMRLGEILGLHWREVDLDGGTLNITRTLKEKRDFGKPKSKTSKRRIDLPPSIARELRAHKKRNRFKKTDLVFTTGDSTPLNPSNFESRHFHPALVRAGIRPIRFHDLRHTCATLLLSSGVNPKVVQEMLGHSSIRVTLDLYSHVMPGMGRAAAEKMDELLG